VDGAVARLGLEALAREVVACRACPRLVAWREQVAADKRAAFRDEEYWGRPVPGFGDPDADIVVVGLAPAAHGANRTGRLFTGDRSGDWLFRALHRAGLANQPRSVRRGDGLELRNAWIAAPVKCAPPDNRPTPAERDACAGFLHRELDLIGPRVVVCLGAFGYAAAARRYGLRPRPRFGHGVEAAVPGGPVLLCSFHPSQQNTFTGRLTEPMFDAIFARAVVLARDADPGVRRCSRPGR
jgi:uracil-DNA glycosylase family 4